MSDTESNEKDKSLYDVAVKQPVSEPYGEEEVKKKDQQGIAMVRTTLVELLRNLDEDPEKRERVADAREFLEELNRRDEYVDLTREEEDYYARQLVQGTEFALGGGSQREPGRAGGNWHQSLLVDGKELRPGVPRPRSKGTTAQRVSALASATGIGIELNVMLPHSGVWVTLRSPSNSAIADFQYRTSEEKVNLAMSNKGFAISSLGYLAYDSIVDFALDNVVASNINYRTPYDLKEKISVLDRNLLIWGLAAVIYPNGADFSFPCTNAECDHVAEEKVNLRRMMFFDRSGLTESQLKHLSTGLKIVPDDAISAYVDLGNVGRSKIIKLSDKIGVEVKPSSLADYSFHSRQWLQQLIKITSDSVNEPPEGHRRQVLMERHSSLTRATQYRHWVSGIVIYEDGDDVEPTIEREDEFITAALSEIISSAKLIDLFLDGLDEYIRDNMVAIVAIPEFRCPVCNKQQEPDSEKYNGHKQLIEIDCASYFFTLINVKVLLLEGAD